MSSAVTKATLKFGGGYEAPWMSVEGTPEEVRAQLIEIFNFGDEVSEASLATLIGYAGLRAQGEYTLARDFGIDSSAPQAEAKPEEAAEAAKPKRKPAAKRASSKAQEPAKKELEAESPAPAPEPATEAPTASDEAPWSERNPLFDEMDKLTTMEGFRSLWSANQSEFQKPEVVEYAKKTQARLKGAA